MKVKELATYNQEELDQVMVLSQMIGDDVKPIFKVKPFVEMTFLQVESQLKVTALSEDAGDFDLIKQVAEFSGVDLTEKDVFNSDISSYFKTLNIIRENFEVIAKRQSQLHTETDPMLQLAGIERMNKYSYINSLVALCNDGEGSITDQNREGSHPWGACWVELMRKKDARQTSIEHDELMNKQAK